MTWDKSCFVPFCQNSSIKNSDKVFFCVPRNPVLRLRWLKAVKRDPSSISKNTRFYCCQDHFDVDKDVINFEGYKTQRGPFKVCFRYGALPSRFECFKNKKVRSIEDLKKKRIIITEETIRLFVDPDYIKGTDLDVVNDTCSPIRFENEIDSISERNVEEISDSIIHKDTTLHSLEEINQLLLDVNNLGILSSVLSAYENVYKHQKKWALQFSLNNAGSSFDCLIRKISDEADTMREDQSTGNSKSYTTNNKKYNQMENHNGNFLEDSDHIKSSFSDALIHGGHNYTNYLLPQSQATKNHTIKKDLKKISVDKNRITEPILNYNKIADVYQCDYCNYGSLYKYRLKHHIISRHYRRYTIFPDEISCENKKVDDIMNNLSTDIPESCLNFDDLSRLNDNEIGNSSYKKTIENSISENDTEFGGNSKQFNQKDIAVESEKISKVKKSRRKRLSYYINSGRTLEIKRLERQIQLRRDWLEEFLKSFDSNKTKSTLKTTNIKRTYSCVLCDFTSSDQTEVYKHTGLSHIYGNSLHLECPCCEFKAVDKIELSSHLITLHYEDDFFKCKLCDYQTDSNEEYFSHICDVHATYSTYRCSYCKFTSSKQDNLQKHITYSHKVQPGSFPFKCDLCDFKTRVKHQYQMHYDSVHLKKKPYQCSFCSNRFAQRGHVVRHIQDIHLKEKPHLCAFCKYRTANRANLKAHLKAIHNVSDENIAEVLKTCINLRKQDSNQSEFSQIAFYDTVDLLPDEDSEASQMIQDIVMEIQ